MKHDASMFDRDHLADCLLAQAHLCERIAARCWDEQVAAKYKKLAQECRDAEKEERAHSVVAAQWPAILAF